MDDSNLSPLLICNLSSTPTGRSLVLTIFHPFIYLFTCTFMEAPFLCNIHLQSKRFSLPATHFATLWFRVTPFLGYYTSDTVSALRHLFFSWSVLSIMAQLPLAATTEFAQDL